jgi:CHAD domain-containing protein
VSRELGADPFEPFGLAAARIVRVRADELAAEADGVLDTHDIERVHDMRVASRRLRAVLEIFAPCWDGATRSEFKEVLRDVKALADALGERRDPDVQIAAMEAFAGAAPAAARAGAALLADRLRARQTQANAVLAAALVTAREHDLHGRLHALAGAAEEAVRP